MNLILHFLPEIYLVITACGLLISEVGYHGENTRIIQLTALVGLVGAFIQVILGYRFPPLQFLEGDFFSDGFSLFFKVFLLVLAGLGIYASSKSQEVHIENRTEHCAAILGSTALLMMACSAANLLFIFIALQLSGLIVTLLIAQKKRSPLAVEAAIKSMGAGMAAFLFSGFGMVLLLGATHSMNIYEIHRVIAAGSVAPTTLVSAFMLLLIGFGLSIGFFPTQLWMPDVLSGGSAPVSLFIAVGVRAASVSVLVRVLLIAFAKATETKGLWEPSTSFQWPLLVATVSGITMITGALLAFRQNSARRLLASLVINQSGFLLIGFLVLDEVGLSALLFNLLSELFALTGAYVALSYLVDRKISDTYVDLRGALSQAVPEVFALMIFLASLAGFPPLPGFIGKLTLLSAAIRHHWALLAIIAAITLFIVVIAVCQFLFYLFSDFKTAPGPTNPPLAIDTGHRIFIIGLLIPLFLMTLFAENLLSFAGSSVQFIFW